jgi:hypothetical protein
MVVFAVLKAVLAVLKQARGEPGFPKTARLGFSSMGARRRRPDRPRQASGGNVCAGQAFV